MYCLTQGTNIIQFPNGEFCSKKTSSFSLTFDFQPCQLHGWSILKGTNTVIEPTKSTVLIDWIISSLPPQRWQSKALFPNQSSLSFSAILRSL